MEEKFFYSVTLKPGGTVVIGKGAVIIHGCGEHGVVAVDYEQLSIVSDVSIEVVTDTCIVRELDKGFAVIRYGKLVGAESRLIISRDCFTVVGETVSAFYSFRFAKVSSGLV